MYEGLLLTLKIALGWSARVISVRRRMGAPRGGLTRGSRVPRSSPANPPGTFRLARILALEDQRAH